MSKFKELTNALDEAITEYRDYELECRDFTLALLDGYKEFLQCPDEALLYFKPSTEIEPGKSTTPIEAMEIRDEAFWHLVVVLNLGNTTDKEWAPIRHEFMIKKEEGHFLVQLEEYDELFRFDSRDSDFIDFYNAVFHKKQQELKKSFQDFLKGRLPKFPYNHVT